MIGQKSRPCTNRGCRGRAWSQLFTMCLRCRREEAQRKADLRRKDRSALCKARGATDGNVPQLSRSA